MHYGVERDPLTGRTMSRPVDVRLVERTLKTESCWLFQGSKDKDGYGWLMGLNERKSHRVALTLKLGRAIGTDLEALHTCDNPPCVNPDHLYEGTEDDNRRDMRLRERYQLCGARGERNGIFSFSPEERRARAAKAAEASKGDAHWTRQHPERVRRGDASWARCNPDKVVKGEQHPRAKLTADLVREIRRQHAEGDGGAAISASMGLARSLVYQVLSGRTWKHVQ